MGHSHCTIESHVVYMLDRPELGDRSARARFAAAAAAAAALLASAASEPVP